MCTLGTGPLPGRFGAALIRRMVVEEAERGLASVILTEGGLWTATCDTFSSSAAAVKLMRRAAVSNTRIGFKGGCLYAMTNLLR